MGLLTNDCDLNLVTGEVTQTSVDFVFPGRLPCHLVRRYSSKEPKTGPFGFGWSHNLGLALRPDGPAMLMGGAGRGDDRFEPDDNGGFATESLAYRLEAQRDGWIVRAKDGTAWLFAPAIGSDGTHRLMSQVDLDGNHLEYRYDDRERLATVLDADGRDVRLHYDESSRVVAITITHAALSREWQVATFGYSLEGDLVTVAGRNGEPVRYEYDNHLLVCAINRLGGKQFFAYDERGRAVMRWRSDGGKVRWIRRDESSKLIEVTNSYGYRTLMSVGEQGQVLKQTDALGRSREDVYDSAGNIVFSSITGKGPPCVTTWDEATSTEIITCAGHQKVVVYNIFDKAVRVADGGGRVSSFEYDDKGHLVRSKDPDGAEMRFWYSDRGEISRVETPTGCEIRIDEQPFKTRIDDCFGLVGITVRDLFGDIESWTGPTGEKLRLRYDGAGMLVRIGWPDGSETAYAYNAEDLPTATWEPTGAVVRMESDAFGRATAVTAPTGARHEFAWDREDRHISVTNPNGAICKLLYDAVGRLITITHFDGRKSFIEYDDGDNPIRQSSEAGIETTATYTPFRDVATRACSNGVEWTFSYNDNAALTAASSDLGSWNIEWTQEGYLQSFESPGRRLVLTRDTLNRRVALRDDAGLEIDYTWDRRSRLESMSVNGALWRFGYDARDLITAMDCPGDLRLSLSYDVMRRMTNRVLTNRRGAVLASRSFAWRTGGYLAAIDDWRLGRREYRVDRAGRLTSVLYGSVERERYEHDPAANLLTTGLGARIVVDQGNRLLSAGDETFAYNREGHVAARRASDVVRYAYDGDDLLRRETRADGVVIEHDYDFIGRRIAKRTASTETKFFWDGGALQTELRSDSCVSHYIMLPDSPIPIGLIRDGRVHVLLFDQIGTVTEAFGPSGALAWAGDYTAFGLLREEVGDLNQPLRALGQYHDRESDLYYNWFRHYDPLLGRYISADPAGYFSSQNLYWYSSNPTVYVDVDGRGSFAGTTLTLNPRCDWTAAQMQDFNNKIADINAQIAAKPPAGEGGALRVSSAAFRDYDREAICASAVQKWNDDCKADPEYKKRKVKNSGKPCTDNDADHRRELVLKGENECHNMTPRNASVNRSCGSQIGNTLRDAFEAQGRSLLTIKTVVAGCCKKPDSDTEPCIKNKAKWNPNVC